MNRVLRRATLLAVGAAMGVVLVVAGLAQWEEVTTDAMVSAKQQADSVANVVAETSDPDRILAAVDATSAGAGGDLAVSLGGGRTIGETHPAGGGTTVVRPVSPAGPALGASRAPAVVVFVPTSALLATLLPRLLVMLIAMALATALAVLVGWRVYRPLIRSVRAITAVAVDAGRGRRGVEIPPSPAAELTHLVNALNQLSHRVEELIVGEREMLADLSHRLRTPLAALRLDAESQSDGPIADRMRQAVRAMEADVNDLIRGAERTPQPASQRCDVAAVARNRVAFWSTLADHDRRECLLDCEADEAPVDLSEQDIAAVLDALLANVFQHTPSGTPFGVAVVRYAGWVTLVVEDGGPGIADTEVALRRGVSTQDSTGLGLDIARHAVETTNGTLHIDRGRLGGARVRLRFAESGTDHTRHRSWRLAA